MVKCLYGAFVHIFIILFFMILYCSYHLAEMNICKICCCCSYCCNILWYWRPRNPYALFVPETFLFLMVRTHLYFLDGVLFFTASNWKNSPVWRFLLTSHTNVKQTHAETNSENKSCQPNASEFYLAIYCICNEYKEYYFR